MPLHPVLPYRHCGKLTIPLEEEMPKRLLKKSHHCPHTPEQQQLRRTWCTPELVKAVEMGYRTKRIHEVWHFPLNQRKTGLFAQYVNTWLKIKQKSAGYPSGVNTPEEKADYIRHYKQKENIDLDPALIVKTPGRKATAKLMLNSFWGKFSENVHKSTMPRISLPTSPTSYSTFIKSESVTTKILRINIFVAAFTTCHARLKLYQSLEFLQQRVLYFHTDSVISQQQTRTVKHPIRRLPGGYDRQTQRWRSHH